MSNRRIEIAPLGGFGEIGMNCLTLEVDGRILVVDCGVMFPTPDRYGIELVHPSFEHLLARRDDIEALVLTHGHEDHIGAVPFLLREMDVPVLAAPYTGGLLEERIARMEPRVKPRVSPLEPGRRIALGPFALDCFPMPHSIIDNLGLLLETPAGTVLHTGDFKLDARGPDGGADTLERLAAMGRRGVDLMICDSTGALEREEAKDEATVASAILELSRGVQGRVFVAVFSSNVRRLAAIGAIAQATGRRLIMAGRSVLSHCRVAAELGALRFPPGLVSEPEEAGELPPERQLIVLSGTQGEERSALARVSAGAHRLLAAGPGDLVILSSRFIPGNEIPISRMVDRLLALGARVVHRGDHPDVHVSGHGSGEEIGRAVAAVAPRSFLPAHGTYRHMAAAERIARRAGVGSTCVARDGRVAALEDGHLFLRDETVPVGSVFIDGGFAVCDAAMRERRLLGDKGLLHVVWLVAGDGTKVGDIDVICKGVVAQEALPWLSSLVRAHVEQSLREAAPGSPADVRLHAEAVRSSLRKLLAKTISREPFVLVSVYPAAPDR